MWWWVWGEQELEKDEITTAMHYIWLARRVKTNPFVNVSSNLVLPFEEPSNSTVVLWIGTSISKVIDGKKIGAKARTFANIDARTVRRILFYDLIRPARIAALKLDLT